MSICDGFINLHTSCTLLPYVLFAIMHVHILSLVMELTTGGFQFDAERLSEHIHMDGYI